MTKKKKTLIIVLSIVAAIAIAVGVTLAVLLTRKPETPPSAGDSTIYQMKSESFWSGFGSAPSASDTVFTLNPKTDKVGENSTPTPPCTEHVDTNPKDGKCDKCGADMPNQGEATVQATLSAETATLKAKIELKNDNTWTLSMCYYGDSYMPTASGTWEMNTTTYNIVLTVTGDEANVLAEDAYTLNVNYETFEYSASILFNLPSPVGDTTFDFDSAVVVENHYTVTYDLNYTDAPAGGTGLRFYKIRVIIYVIKSIEVRNGIFRESKGCEKAVEFKSRAICRKARYVFCVYKQMGERA